MTYARPAPRRRGDDIRPRARNEARGCASARPRASSCRSISKAGGPLADCSAGPAEAGWRLCRAWRRLRSGPAASQVRLDADEDAPSPRTRHGADDLCAKSHSAGEPGLVSDPRNERTSRRVSYQSLRILRRVRLQSRSPCLRLRWPLPFLPSASVNCRTLRGFPRRAQAVVHRSALLLARSASRNRPSQLRRDREGEAVCARVSTFLLMDEWPLGLQHATPQHHNDGSTVLTTQHPQSQHTLYVLACITVRGHVVVHAV